VAFVDVADDGLFCPEVGRWTEEKHSLVSLYAKLFSTGMKDKWEERVYIELYAGAGHSKLRGSSRRIGWSPLRALLLEHPFDKYIFCEEGAVEMEALKVRVSTAAPTARVAFIPGDCNLRTDEILGEIPAHRPGHRVLSLCFVDPYDIGIEFQTLRKLSQRYVDFLILLALGMDANRNYERYLKDDADKVDKFLGSGDWRGRWAAAQWDAIKFTTFLADEFTRSMATLGYIPPAHYTMKEVRSYERNFTVVSDSLVLPT